MTSFNVLVKKKEAVAIRLQLCQPYPSGSVTASATPIMTQRRLLLRPDFFVQGALPSGYQAVPTDYFERFPGDTLPQTIVWDATAQLWRSSPRPDVWLSSSYSQTTGIATITIPFGTSFQRFPSDEFDPGHSPRLYVVVVRFNGAEIASGTVDIAENINAPPSPTFPKVCSTDVGAGAAAAPGASTSQATSPWVVGG